MPVEASPIFGAKFEVFISGSSAIVSTAFVDADDREVPVAINVTY